MRAIGDHDIPLAPNGSEDSVQQESLAAAKSVA